MFLIKRKLAPSTLHGIGVFADEDIPKGAIVYRHTPELDIQLTDEQFRALEQAEQETILHYGYRDKRTGLYRLDHDDIRFVNDSRNPNIGYEEDSGNIIALREIAHGEELTQSYADFEERRFAE